MISQGPDTARTCMECTCMDRGVVAPFPPSVVDMMMLFHCSCFAAGDRRMIFNRSSAPLYRTTLPRSFGQHPPRRAIFFNGCCLPGASCNLRIHQWTEESSSSSTSTANSYSISKVLWLASLSEVSRLGCFRLPSPKISIPTTACSRSTSSVRAVRVGSERKMR